MQIRKSARHAAKMRMAIQGPSGSGKTYSSILLAKGLVKDLSRVVVIDTENNSADLYSHLGDYNVMAFSRPFSPERFIQAIEESEIAGMEVIIIDSISHEWEGEGGILESHANMPGNSFTNWSKLTPRHNAFVQRMLSSSAHVIATIRSKQDYVISDKNGKMVPEKVGLKGVTRDSMDYEFTLVFDMQMNHQAKVSKDRTGLFNSKEPRNLNEEVGHRIAQWCSEDNHEEKTDSFSESFAVRIEKAHSMEELKKLYRMNPIDADRFKQFFTKRKYELQKHLQNGSIEHK